MCENFDFTVPIKDELKKCLVLGLRSRLAIVNVLAFSGCQQHVMPLMQTLSHDTRAYIFNADGLPNFFTKFDIMKHLEEAEKAG